MQYTFIVTVHLPDLDQLPQEVVYNYIHRAIANYGWDKDDQGTFDNTDIKRIPTSVIALPNQEDKELVTGVRDLLHKFKNYYHVMQRLSDAGK